MPIWPFRRRRRANTDNHDASADKKQLLSEKAAQPSRSLHAASPPPRDTDTPPPVPSRPSRPSSKPDSARRPTLQADEKAAEARNTESPAGQQRLGSANKENVPPRNKIANGSKENVTALPLQQHLARSPHLRPVDLDKPQIPYSFHPHSSSQTSVQRQEALAKLSKSSTLRSKRSTQDYSAPSRTFSRKSKRDVVREEEIRSMTTPIPIPKRPGDGPLRRESKKVRGLNGDSQVSLPPEGSIHSSMSGVVEQRGWEVGSIAAVFNPRPAVRLSGLPQYVSSSLPPTSSGLLYRIDSAGGNEKAPSTPKGKDRRKRRTVGTEADDLGSGDIRAIMERDAKRRERKQIERQERLDRKLRSAGRDKADTERKRRNSEERRRAEQHRARLEQELQTRGVLTPPSDVHPALRDARPEVIGLGIGDRQEAQSPAAAHADSENPFVLASESPFVDAAEQPLPSPRSARAPYEHPTLLESPMEEPYLGTAQAVRLSQANTPPLSPVYGRTMSSASQLPLTEITRQESASRAIASGLAPPPRIPVERRSSDPPSERKTGTWAAFFKRGGTFRRSMQEEKPIETGFSNTSRDSMRNQPIQAHLIGTDPPRSPIHRSASGTPVRTQSKFREDLPEMPISPPESREQTPDVAMAAAAAATARRSQRGPTPQPVDIPGRVRDAEGDVYMSGRNDTPTSVGGRGHVAMSASMASIGSEGSWLASGGSKRQSNQSALSRSFSKRNAEFTASYEELGVDKDAEYFSRNPGSKTRRGSNAGELISPDEESDEDGPKPPTPDKPLTVHDSVRRKPTLVQHDPRLVSREGLVQEFAAQEVAPEDAELEGVETPYETPYERSPHTSDHDSDDPESSSPQIQRATEIGRARSIQMKSQNSRHSRQFSAGSAKLLDLAGKRASADVSREPTPIPRSPPLSRTHSPV